MNKIGQNIGSLDKNCFFSVDLAFENKRKQHINICSQSQTNKCRKTKGCFLTWFADKHLRILQSKHLQCSFD